jgi:hypothetical protein
MTPIDTELLQRYRAATSVLASLPADVASYRAADEATILEVTRLFADAQRLLGTAGALIAGEVAHRSTVERGSAGLAQRTGFRTPEEFIRATTRSTKRDAVTVVNAGRLVHEAATAGQVDPLTGEILLPSRPWLASVAAGLSAGRLSAAAVDAIASGLGAPNSAVSVEQLALATEQLAGEAATLDPDRLYRRARQLRDELDQTGITLREEERRAARSARLTQKPDGGGVLVWQMDPETFAAVQEVCDRATSPRRGGPRFVNAADQALAETITADSRTTDQYLSDAILELLRLGAGSSPRFLLGSGAPVVRVTVTKRTLDARHGFGRIEGQPGPVSIETVERLACSGDTVEAGFSSDGQPLDVGREQRFYTRPQRIALALRDGGCRWPGCERPPSWTEAHHTKYWTRDRGKTDIADGMPFSAKGTSVKIWLSISVQPTNRPAIRVEVCRVRRYHMPKLTPDIRGRELFRSSSHAESLIGILARRHRDVGLSHSQLHRDTRTYATLST